MEEWTPFYHRVERLTPAESPAPALSRIELQKIIGTPEES